MTNENGMDSNGGVSRRHEFVLFFERRKLMK